MYSLSSRASLFFVSRSFLSSRLFFPVPRRQFVHSFFSAQMKKVSSKKFFGDEGDSGSHASRISRSADLEAVHYAQMEALYEAISAENNGLVPISTLVRLLADMGIDASNDVRVAPLLEPFADRETMTLEEFVSIQQKSFLIERALNKSLVIPDWKSYCEELDATFASVASNTSGDVARYIPQLARVNPEQFAMAFCSVDGQRHSVGDSRVPFCVQSCSKTISYCIALEEHGQDKVHKHVGREPSGRNFNELILNKDNLPHNPYINSGAIMTTSLIRPALRWPERIQYVLRIWSLLAGDTRIGFDNATYLSESATADRNFTLGYLMKENGGFPTGTDLVETLQMYFMMCSIETTSEQLACVAATLASGGICPLTGKRVFQPDTVRNCLSLMQSCGMYDYSGQYAFEVGFPGKSGVSGCVMAVVPGVGGFCVWSPRLDSYGNSVRGIDFCRSLATKFNFHTFDAISDASVSEKKNPRLHATPSVEDDLVNLLFAAAVGDMMRVMQLAMRGCALDYADYDGRTALHLAASGGHKELVEFLLAKGVNHAPKDRFGNTPKSDAERYGHATIAKVIADCEENPQASTNSGWSNLGRDQLVTLLQANGLDPTLLPNSVQCEEDLINYFASSMNSGQKGAGNRTSSRADDLIRRAFDGSLVVPDFPALAEDLQKMFDDIKANVAVSAAHNASYIPELAAVDPELFGAAVCTIDGQRAYYGDAVASFTAQHCANVLTYCAALEQRGEKYVHQRIGREPSGQASNQLTLNHQNKPYNPFTNKGALSCCEMIGARDTPLADRYDAMLRLCRRAVGTDSETDVVGFDLAVFLSEYQHSDRNRCLLYHMREKGALPANTNLDEVLQLYLMMCSLDINCASMSVLAATLASGGICPLSGERVFQPATVRACLSLMSSCGMYDWSGEWQFLIGLPGLAGASGGVMIVIPGVMGFAVYSPSLNKSKISQRGIEFASRLAAEYAFHPFEVGLATAKKNPSLWKLTTLHRDISALCTAASKDDLSELRRLLARKLDVSIGDYDGRTALHLAASSGHPEAVRMLMAAGADATRKDRWGSTPADDANKVGCQKAVMYMRTVTPQNASSATQESSPCRSPSTRIPPLPVSPGGFFLQPKMTPTLPSVQ